MQRLLRRSPLLLKHTQLTQITRRTLVQPVRVIKPTTSSKFSKFLLPVGVGMLAGTSAFLAWNINNHLAQSDEPKVTILIEKPATEFVHPYADAPWYWRWYFSAGRILYLLYVFAPVAAVSMATAVMPSNTSLREYWLDTLIKAIENAGCSFQKLAQWVSMRPDMFPEDLVQALGKLRNDSPVHNFKATKKAFREAFGCEIEDIFESFDEQPVASGTVAQVHRARLKPEYAENGVQDVAVKVRHPNVLNETFVDLEFVFKLASWLKTSKNSLALPFSQEECLSIMRQQLDLTWEAYNLSKFSANFSKDIKQGLVNFPTVVKEFLSESVLVESWMPGRSLDSYFGESKKWVADKAVGIRKDMARTVFDMALKMFLRDNHIHGDLHAGNLLFDSEQGLTIIDAGLVTQLEPGISRSFAGFLRAVCSNDVPGITRKIMDFNTNNYPVDEKAFAEDIQKITDKFVGPIPGRAVDGGHIGVGDLVGAILLRLNHHKIQLRGDVAHALNCISLTEGVIMQLDPEFDIIGEAIPYFLRYPLPAAGGVSTSSASEPVPAEPSFGAFNEA